MRAESPSSTLPRRGRFDPEAPLHLSVDSTKPLTALCADLLDALTHHGLTVVRSSATPGSPPRDGGADSAGSAIFEIADPLPELRPATGAPPGRDGSTYKIAAYEATSGRTRVSTIRPTHLVELLGHPELNPAAERFEATLVSALRQAAGFPAGPGTTSGS